MSQALSRPDLFGRTRERTKPTLRQKLSSGLVGLVSALVVWSFALATAGKCLWYAKQVWEGGMAEFLNASMGSLSFSAAGLHYEGKWGAVMAGGQGLGVLLGLALTLSPMPMARRFGALLLISWAGLWVSGGVSLAMEVREPEQVGVAAATLAIFICTLLRTARLWSNPKRKKS